MVILDYKAFWYEYAVMIVVFSIALYFDLMKPLAISLRGIIFR